MIVEPRITLSREGLVTLARIARLICLPAELRHAPQQNRILHVVESRIFAPVPVKECASHETSRLLADLRPVLGNHLDLHVDAVEFARLADLFLKAPQAAFVLTLTTQQERDCYYFNIDDLSGGLARFPAPATMPRPLVTTEIIDVCQPFILPDRVNEKLKPGQPIDIKIFAEQAYAIGVVDPAQAGDPYPWFFEYVIKDGMSETVPDCILRGPAFLPLVARDRLAKGFMKASPARLSRRYWKTCAPPIVCRVVRLPQDPQPFWLITHLDLAGVNVQLQEPLTLIDTQHRQLDEPELLSRLAALAA